MRNGLGMDRWSGLWRWFQDAVIFGLGVFLVLRSGPQLEPTTFTGALILLGVIPVRRARDFLTRKEDDE